MTLTLAHPHWLLLLLALPLHLLIVRGRGARGLPFPGSGAGARRRSLGFLAGSPLALRLLTLLLLVLALARPRSAGAVIEETVEGVPIVIAVDISSSMLAEDFLPLNRLEVARRTVAEFIGTRRGDPIGLVAFAGEAITLVPITTHRPMLMSAVEALQIGVVEDGTAIGEGLAVATSRLRTTAAGEGVVILMSDGENNRGEVEPLVAADAAAALGIRVFTIGVGSEGVAPVPVQRLPTGMRYAELPVGIDEALLREIAARTGGEYFRATDTPELREIYERIDALVGSPIQTRRTVEYREWYLLLLLGAALALAGEWGLRGSRWGALP
jgi:Ca-activated chloride channel homolog